MGIYTYHVWATEHPLDGAAFRALVQQLVDEKILSEPTAVHAGTFDDDALLDGGSSPLDLDPSSGTEVASAIDESFGRQDLEIEWADGFDEENEELMEFLEERDWTNGDFRLVALAEARSITPFDSWGGTESDPVAVRVYACISGRSVPDSNLVPMDDFCLDQLLSRALPGLVRFACYS